MARQRVQQNSLISGVIAPTLLGRVDLDKYYNAVEEAENVVIMPHGGMQRRDGLKYLTSVPTGSRLFSFEFSVSQNYVFVLSTTDLIVYLPNSGTPLATEAWGSALTIAQLNDMDIIQSADTVIIVHPDFNPIIIKREGSDTAWSISNMPLVNIPKYDYDTALTPSHFNYGTSVTVDIAFDEIVYNNDGNNTNGVNEFLYKAIVPQTGIDLSTEDYSNTTNWETLVTRPNVWGVTPVKYTYINSGVLRLRIIVIGDIIFNNDGNDVNGLDGHYYISKVNLPLTSLANIDYSNTTDWDDLGEGDLTDKGWPNTCTFHQGRLWFGGSASKPTSVWGSVVNNFFNFDTGKDDVQADDAIFDVLDTDQFNAIVNIVSSKVLQVMTAGGEFTNTAEVITPFDSAWIRDTGYGGSRIKPVVLDGATYFMDRFRKTVRGFIYNFNEGGYTSPPISILAEHIINDVQDLDIVRGSSISVSNLLYLVNGDGTVAVFNTMRQENIAGWTKWTTNGLFKRVTVTSDKVTFIVERDGTEYLEYLDNSVLLDHTFSDTSSDRVEVDALLFANEIRVVADGITQTATAAIDDEGTYYGVADREADEIYAGMNYNVIIKTLPISANTSTEGNIVNIPRRITKAIVNLYESRGVYVNGELVTTRKFGEDNLDVALTPITGIETVFLLGYNTKAQVEITQTNPEPLTLLALDLEVSF